MPIRDEPQTYRTGRYTGSPVEYGFSKSTMECAQILQRLASRPDPHAVEGMARFGIVAKKVYGGWSTPALKKLAREIGRDHALAQELWASEVYEARALATMIDEPRKGYRAAK